MVPQTEGFITNVYLKYVEVQGLFYVGLHLLPKAEDTQDDFIARF